MMKKALRDKNPPPAKGLHKQVDNNFKRLEALTRTPCNLPRALKIFPLEWYFGKSPFPVGTPLPGESRGGSENNLIRIYLGKSPRGSYQGFPVRASKLIRKYFFMSVSLLKRVGGVIGALWCPFSYFCVRPRIEPSVWNFQTILSHGCAFAPPYASV